MGKYISRLYNYAKRRKLITLCVVVIFFKIVYTIGVKMTHLEMKVFMELPGTMTSLSVIDDDIYYAQHSVPTGSLYAPLTEEDSVEIRKISITDFLARKESSTTLASMPGIIASSCASHDKIKLYFMHKKLLSDKSRQINLESIDLASHIISTVSPCDTFGGNLKDIAGKAIAEFGATYANILQLHNLNWSLFPKKPWRGKLSVYLENGNLYYINDESLFLIEKNDIVNESYVSRKIYSLPGDKSVNGLFVRNGDIYVTAYDGGRAYIIDISTGEKHAIDMSNIMKENVLVETIFKYNNSIWCRIWTADSPFSMETRIAKIENKNIQTTEPLSDSVKFLGVVSNYLVFSHTMPFSHRCNVFGIKYKEIGEHNDARK